MQDKLVLESIGNIWFAVSPKLRDNGIKHVFTTRFFGQSAMCKGDLNMSLHVGDSEPLVIDNRKKVCDALQIDFSKLTAAKQIHEDNIVCIDESLVGSGYNDYAKAIDDTDALITNLAGVPLMLLFADCVPTIIADPVKKVVAVVHGGWRSTVLNIAQKTVQRMVEEFSVNPKDCFAVIGPSICPSCYQVGEEVYGEASKNLQDFQELFSKDKEGNLHFDLWQANFQQLFFAGLLRKNIVKGELCTVCNKRLFFSHRADKGVSGRLAAMVWL